MLEKIIFTVPERCYVIKIPRLGRILKKCVNLSPLPQGLGQFVILWLV
jgi:hypothetical protein